MVRRPSDDALGDVEAEPEELAMDSWGPRADSRRVMRATRALITAWTGGQPAQAYFRRTRAYGANPPRLHSRIIAAASMILNCPITSPTMTARIGQSLRPVCRSTLTAKITFKIPSEDIKIEYDRRDQVVSATMTDISTAATKGTHTEIEMVDFALIVRKS